MKIREVGNEFDLLIMLGEVELDVEIPDEKAEKERPPNWKAPNEVRAARNKEVRQTPQRNPTTQIRHGNELPICIALCETTLSRDLWFKASIFSPQMTISLFQKEYIVMCFASQPTF